MDAFIERLTNAHHDFQLFGAHVGYATRSQGGSCIAFYYWDIALHAPVYANVPEAWQPLTSEYVALMDQAVEIVQPIIQVCQAGGGTVDDTTDQQFLAFFDHAQNRVYELIQQAEAMK